jgi:hypothetical protein
LKGGEWLEGWWCVICKYVLPCTYLFDRTHLATRKNRCVAGGVGFYRNTCATSTLRTHLSQEGGTHYQYYHEMCEKHNILVVLKSPDLKKSAAASTQSDISLFLNVVSPLVTWSREGLLSHICEWVVLDDQVRVSLYGLPIHTHTL